MLFSSNIFLYVFLPILFILYFFPYLKKVHTYRNLLLLGFSLFFYLYGCGRYIMILFVSIGFNYAFGIFVDRLRPKKLLLSLGLAVNLLLLLFYKYFNFLYTDVFKFPEANKIFLPVGISFFTFQAMSYLIDVYRKDIPVQTSLYKLALYISFFPQLVAGPIVRYGDMNQDINHRKDDFDTIYQGACRFCFGLAKKVVFADNFGLTVDQIFALQPENLSTPLAWSGALLYTLQIYFDFSAYSDMAIGLANIFGFHFNENFIMPYSSKNVTEFWRRWHISLSSWFRDYLYIPLGGNRKGTIRTYFNLFIVFFLCGLWHGAGFSFIVWGLYHGMLLVIERILLTKFRFKLKGFVGNIITFLLVMFGWVLFRSPDLSSALRFMSVMLGKQQLQGFQYYTYFFYLNIPVIFYTILGLILSLFPLSKIKEGLMKSSAYGICAALLLFFSMLYLADATFNPFIYFQF